MENLQLILKDMKNKLHKIFIKKKLVERKEIINIVNSNNTHKNFFQSFSD